MEQRSSRCPPGAAACPQSPPVERASRLAILADDFTGACDAAGAFAAAGVPARVHLATPTRTLAPPGVTAVDLDLRESADAAARVQAQAAAARLRAAGATRFIAKIDSTLRGPIPALLDGILAGASLRGALVAPAFPEQGRLLRGGRLQRLEGGREVAGADLLARLREWRSLPPERPTAAQAAAGPAALAPAHPAAGVDAVTLLPLAEVRGDPVALRQRLLSAEAAPRALVVADADSSACLRALAEVWRSIEGWLLAGSAGIARQVALLAAGVEQRQAPTGLQGPGDGGLRTSGWAGGGPERPVLVVAGSPAAATRAQLRVLQAAAGVQTVDVAPGEVPPAALPDSDVVVLRSAEPGERGRDGGEHAAVVARAALAVASPPAGLVLAGGATARRLCELLAVEAVEIIGELAPGIPTGRLVGGAWDGVRTVTKAGGFGGPDALLDAVRWLRVS